MQKIKYFGSLCIFFIFIIALSNAKPPKGSLSRMRGRGGKLLTDKNQEAKQLGLSGMETAGDSDGHDATGDDAAVREYGDAKATDVVKPKKEEVEEETEVADDGDGDDQENADETEPVITKTTTTAAPTVAMSDTELINRLLGKGYDWRVRPPGTNLTVPGNHGPVVVSVNMLIRSISKIDDVNMEYSVQLTFRERWVDGRLAYGYPNDEKPDFLILTEGQNIWMPDSFFQNEKQAQRHMIDKPNVLIRIHKDGSILYSVRISLVLSCPMHLQDYPMDVQTCLIDLASYAYTTDDIEYMWQKETPIQLKPGLNSSLPSFQLNNVTTTYCTSKTNTGVYSCLRTIIELRRQFSYYLLQLYIPSVMLVVVSWVSFWLDRTAVPARITLGVTTLLTMTTQASGINAKLPPVSYTKAIDVWIGACLTFIFGALLEFAWVTYVSSRNFYKTSKQPCHAKPTLIVDPGFSKKDTMPVEEVWLRQSAINIAGSTAPASSVDMQEMMVMTVRNRRRWNPFKHLRLPLWFRTKFATSDQAKKADLFSRFFFPMLFVVFNCVYWYRYTKYQAPVIP